MLVFTPDNPKTNMEKLSPYTSPETIDTVSGAKQLIGIHEKWKPEVHSSIFKEIHDLDEIASDLTYEQEQRSRFKEMPLIEEAAEAAYLILGRNKLLLDKTSQEGLIITPSFETSTDYDDYAHGADFVLGITLTPQNKKERKEQPPEYLPISIDATVGMSEENIKGKFTACDVHGRAMRSSRIKYCLHRGRGKDKVAEDIEAAPHYIIGTTPKKMWGIIDGFGIGDTWIEYPGAESEAFIEFRKKTLIELYVQSDLGCKSCRLKKDELKSQFSAAKDPTEKEAIRKEIALANKVLKAHTTAYVVSRDSLFTLFGIDKEDKEADNKLADEINGIILAESNTADTDRDSVFCQIVSEALQRKSEVKKQTIAKKAINTSDDDKK